MIHSREFDRYLQDFRSRLRRLAMARGVAAIALGALVLSLVIVTMLIRSGFPDDLLIAGRVMLLIGTGTICLLYTSPSPRDQRGSRMPSSA